MNWKITLLSFLIVPAIMNAGMAVDVSIQINEDIIEKTIIVDQAGQAEFEEAGFTVSLRIIAQDEQDVELELSVLKNEEVISQPVFCVVWDTDAELHLIRDEQEIKIKLRPSKGN